jgi:hypothetical protein
MVAKFAAIHEPKVANVQMRAEGERWTRLLRPRDPKQESHLPLAASVGEQLGDPKSSSDSISNFSFWPAPTGSLVYRFDSGANGWQFNVLFGEDGRVTSVERHWIH